MQEGGFQDVATVAAAAEKAAARCDFNNCYHFPKARTYDSARALAPFAPLCPVAFTATLLNATPRRARPRAPPPNSPRPVSAAALRRASSATAPATSRRSRTSTRSTSSRARRSSRCARGARPSRALPRRHARGDGLPRPGEVPPAGRRRAGDPADPEPAAVHVVRDDARHRHRRGLPRQRRLVEPERAEPRLPEAPRRLRAGRPRLRSARPQARGPGRVPRDADEGAQNGRLAMLAAAGFMAQEAVSGDTWGAYWACRTSKSRALRALCGQVKQRAPGVPRCGAVCPVALCLSCDVCTSFVCA